MNRREFLRRGVTGAAVIPGMAFGRRGGVRAASQPGSALPGAELEEVTVATLQARFAGGQLTARAVTEQYLARIEALDRDGPRLRAIIEVNPDALDVADTRDRERAEGRVRGPLHGIPVLLKDNIDTADRMTTTAGSLALEGSIAARDAEVARRLRNAGAVLLGKTNLSEWANFRSTRSSSGWSARGGQCRNPYVLDRNPCGSSSGSGVAVSANLGCLAVGTETDGSIVCPASANGVVGIKPTVGLVSRRGIIPIAHSQDTAGPMTRTVQDAALLLGILAGRDREDLATRGGPAPTPDYSAALEPGGLRGARIGIVRALFGFHDDVDEVLEDAFDAMRRAGAILVDPVRWPRLPRLADYELTVLLYEFKHGLNRYLSALAPSVAVHSLTELIAFNDAHRDLEMPYFGQEILRRAEERGPLSDPVYQEAVAAAPSLARQAIDSVMTDHRLDALVAPTGGPAWTTDLVNGDHFSGGSSRPAAVAGYPNVTVPAGDVQGLPIGLSLFGRAWSEPTLIRLAFGFERARPARRRPGFVPTIDTGAD